ncbi:4-coumarate--CoA ligase-like 6 [Dendrobium catenatum]|uniref:4-coumarate--CoA ligase n=1 Tax=Dendrobium catenatum TaxID=906689 RepID=A0A2I0W0V0_9ASPA|nr:4-coumarate--CoA ligase-like 6 [Dendrobium catenatum]PKU69277.1 4-coumarate--CoA ligase-like 6 [Dendrobium catenatum]
MEALSHPKPIWFCPKTGIYTSKHSPIPLTQNPLQDLVTFLFSKPHKGEKALIDSLSGLYFSYSDIRSKVEALVSGLHQVGILKGQVVLILLPNSIFFPIVLLSVLSLGAIITTMNPLSSPQEIKKLTAGLNIGLVFAQLEKVGTLDSLGVPVVSVPSDLNYDSSKFTFFDKMISCKQQITFRPVIQQSDPAAILFTSGTSGFSKAVILTHGNFIAMVELFVRFEASQYEKESWKDVYLATIPMFHVYGMSLFVFGLLSLGSTIVVMKRFDAHEAIRAMDRYEVTHLPLVPPIMAALIKTKDATGCVLRSLKQVSCGAAPLSQKLIKEFLCRFEHVDLIQGYGMTESTAVGTRGFNNKNCKKYTSSGLLAPNMEAKVVDQEDRIFLPPGKMGELWLRGPAIMKGYLTDEKGTASIIDRNGWLKTGDIGYFDHDGYLFIVDRLKDVIKYKGFQVAPADLEAVLTSNTEIIDAAVTSDLDEEAGEIPVAFVVKRHDSNISAAEIVKFVAKKVAPYKKVRRVVFVQSIPRTAAGKIMRRELRNCYCASKL